jgi:predicted RNase H-like HicB family nuclease
MTEFNYRRYESEVQYMKIKGRTFTYVVRKAEEGGYTARCIELPQVHIEGETLNELKKNMRDALSLALDYLKERAEKEKGELVEITV